MRKKRIRLAVAIVALALAALVAVPALAVWIGTIWVETEVKEPITYSLGPEEIPSIIFPGERFSFSKEIENKAPVPYGMSYGGWLYWVYEGEKGAVSENEEVKIALSEVEELKVPAKAGGWDSLGRITFTLDPDGDGPKNPQLYRAGEVVDISAHGIHRLSVFVDLAYDISPGHLRVEIYTTRGAPLEEV